MPQLINIKILKRDDNIIVKGISNRPIQQIKVLTETQTNKLGKIKAKYKLSSSL